MDIEGLVVACPRCASKNRILLERLAEVARCGRCSGPIRSPTGPIELDDESFATVIARAGVPVIVDFWAGWCGPCKAFAPTFERFAAAADGRVLAAKVDVDRAPRTASQHGIQSIPTVALFRGGREVDRHVGMATLKTLEHLALGG